MAKSVKERGITFNAEMVRAILDGRKTQTRRVIKNQREGDCWSVRPALSPRHSGHTHDWWLPKGTLPYSALPSCPFGKVGDRLWVKETYAVQGDKEKFVAHYKSDDPSRFSLPDMRFKSPVTMPRWASRLTLEITDVRVERLQDISQADAISEGGPPSHPSIDAVSRDYGFPDFSRSWFVQTWWSIYGEDSWQSNPWVWVISFRQVEEAC